MVNKTKLCKILVFMAFAFCYGESDGEKAFKQNNPSDAVILLESEITNGTASSHASIIVNSAGEYIGTAGKTGTTDDNLDKWFCGFTSYYSAAVWYGYDNRLKQTKIPKVDYYNAGRIWEYCMQNIHKNLPAASFKKPATVVKASYCSKSGMAPTDQGKDAKTVKSDYFVKGSYLYPKEECKVHAAPTPTPAGTVKPGKVITPAPEGETG